MIKQKAAIPAQITDRQQPQYLAQQDFIGQHCLGQPGPGQPVGMAGQQILANAAIALDTQHRSARLPELIFNLILCC